MMCMATANRDIYDPYLLRVIRLLKQTVEENGGQISDWKRLDYIEQNQRYYTLAFRYTPRRLTSENSSRWVLWENNAAVFLDSHDSSELGTWQSGFSLYSQNHLTTPETIAHHLYERLTDQSQNQKPVLPKLT